LFLISRFVAKLYCNSIQNLHFACCYFRDFTPAR